MADGYTLSDQEMRDWVVAVDAIGGHGGVSVRRYERWLAAHDEKVRAEQREEVVTVVEHIADEHSVALTNQANAFDSRWEQGALGASEAILRAIRAVPANTNTEESNRG